MAYAKQVEIVAGRAITADADLPARLPAVLHRAACRPVPHVRPLPLLASTDVVYEQIQSGRLEEEVTTAPSSRVAKPRIEEETVAKDNMDLLGWLRKQLAEAEPDLLREMVRTSPRA